MSGLKKRGPSRRAPKRARQASASSSANAIPNSRRRAKRDSLKGFFFEQDYD